MRVELGSGLEPAIAVTPDQIVVAIGPTDSNPVSRVVWLRHDLTIARAQFFPALGKSALTSDGRYLITQGLDGRARLIDLVGGHERDLGPCQGQCTARAGVVAWQAADLSTCYVCAAFDGPAIDTLTPGCGRGLAYLDGIRPVTWDTAHYSIGPFLGLLDPRPVGDLWIGTGPQGGITILRNGVVHILAAGEWCDGIRGAVCGDLYVFACYGDKSGGVRVWTLTSAEIDALPIPGASVPDPPPVQEPPVIIIPEQPPIPEPPPVVVVPEPPPPPVEPPKPPPAQPIDRWALVRAALRAFGKAIGVKW